MAKVTVGDLKDIKGKRVLVRVDFNVPLSGDGKTVEDDTRIKAALPTIKHLVEGGARVILASHLGRPKAGPDPKLSLAAPAAHLGKLLGRDVKMAPECVGPEVDELAKGLADGDILMLENVRFHKEERKNDPAFAEKLASVAELYVNDAFGSAHRAHGSTEGVTKFLSPAAAGFLLEKEIEAFGKALGEPEKPFVAILGGAKVSDKIGVIRNLLAKVDSILIGGAMAYTFLKAEGSGVGKSLTEDDKLDLAKELLAEAKAKGVALMLPTDHVVADDFKADANSKTVDRAIPDGWMGVDIGPATIEAYCAAIAGAKTVVWNGPMGVFEMEPFAKGTFAVAKAVADSDCISVVGGGDSVRAINESGLAGEFTHISTGGGASLELLEGKILPGIAALTEK
ncbi:MAG: phosphoglycerate kinase [Planctomycetota bacterium]|jgi:phosphoglycerate kinase